jgi:serine/threonine-protein kinase
MVQDVSGQGGAEGGDPDEEGLSRATSAASAVALARFHALMAGKEPAGFPVVELVSALERPRMSPGAVLAQYRIVRELGSGGMGTVFLAERADGQFRRQVAIKVLRGLVTEEGKRRLRAERQMLAELDHPRIARLLDGGETAEGQPYLVLEYVEGEQLYAAVARRGLDLEGRVRLVEQIGEAVAHAHQRLVVHRDLKPNNVLVTQEGRPRLLDFGVARFVSDVTETSSTRVFSPGYASPEQMAGGRITTRTDVFALGVLLGELVQGVRAGGGPLEPLLAPVPPDADLRGIALKASAESPDDRYASVDSFLDDLRRWREGLPVRARPDTALYRAGRFVRRHRALVAAAVLVVASTTGLVIGLANERRRAQRAEAAALGEQRRAQGEAEKAQREAARARRLLEFLSQTFDAAAPDNARGKPLSASEVLREAQGRLEGATTTPEDRTALLLMLADLADRLGESARSLSLSELAVQALPEPTDAASAVHAAQAWEARSDILCNSGHAAEGVEAARKAVALLARLAPDDAAAREASQVRLGKALVSNLDVAGRPILERVLADAGSSIDLLEKLGASDLLFALAMSLHDAPRALEEAHRTRRQLEALPPGHPRRYVGKDQEAGALRALGRFQEALPLEREAIAERERAFGPHGSQLADLYDGLAIILNELGRYREAAAAIERSRALLLEVGGGGDDLATVEANAAAIIESSGDYPRAEALFRRALAGGDRIPRLLRGNLLSSLGRSLALQGRSTAARAVLQQAAAVLGDQDDGVVGFYLLQVDLYSERAQAARADFEKCRERLADAPPQLKWHLERAGAKVLLLEGHLAEAERKLRSIEPEAVARWGPESFQVSSHHALLAEVLARAGRTGEARGLLDRALPVLRAAVLPQERTRAAAEALDRRLQQR